MGWEKGKTRGPSPLLGRSQLPLDPRFVEETLGDDSGSPEDRFVAVMEVLLEAMAKSTNKNTARVGFLLRSFWDNEMANTLIYTPLSRGDTDGPRSNTA